MVGAKRATVHETNKKRARGGGTKGHVVGGKKRQVLGAKRASGWGKKWHVVAAKRGKWWWQKTASGGGIKWQVLGGKKGQVVGEKSAMTNSYGCEHFFILNFIPSGYVVRHMQYT